MLRIDVPGRESLALEHVVLDLNGTLALDGVFVEGVLTRLERLQRQLAVWVVTADTRGEAQALVQDLGVNLHKVDRGDEAVRKRALVEQLGLDRTAAIGNGANDVAMLEAAALGICVVGTEGAATEALLHSDVVVPDMLAALELLIHTDRLTATLRR